MSLVDNRILARILRTHGDRLIGEAVNRLIPEAEAKPARSSLSRKIAGGVLMRIATRSVPGAILVGGGILAKRLHDRHKAKQAAEAMPPAGPRKAPHIERPARKP